MGSFWRDKKDGKLNYWALLGLILGVGAVGPALIFFLHSKANPDIAPTLATMWSVGELLGYWGALMSTSAAAYVGLSIVRQTEAHNNTAATGNQPTEASASITDRSYTCCCQCPCCARHSAPDWRRRYRDGIHHSRSLVALTQGSLGTLRSTLTVENGGAALILNKIQKKAPEPLRF